MGPGLGSCEPRSLAAAQGIGPGPGPAPCKDIRFFLLYMYCVYTYMYTHAFFLRGRVKFEWGHSIFKI